MKLVVPELISVGALLTIHLVTLNPIPVMTTAPMLAWLIYMYRTNPRGYVSLFDSSNICDQKVLKMHVRHCLFKTVFHLAHFTAYMYMAILTLNTV